MCIRDRNLINYSALNQKIGILGGGQLARYLALRGAEIGYQIHVYSENASDPAAQVTRYWHQGSLSQMQKLKKFISSVDILTFESEFADIDMIQAAIKNNTNKLKIHPNLDILSKLQDRLTQKELLIKYKLPTSKFMEVSTYADLTTLKRPFVLKNRRNGYDGYGVHIIKTKDDLEKLKYKRTKDLYIAEDYIPFTKELAQTYVH